MDKRLMELKSWGCDIDDTMERFLDDEEFYFECYEQVMNDPEFDNLKEALEKHDVEHAFEAAHSLKGIIANLGLTSLTAIIADIVEPLRVGKDDGLLKKYQELLEERKKYLTLQ